MPVPRLRIEAKHREKVAIIFSLLVWTKMNEVPTLADCFGTIIDQQRKVQNRQCKRECWFLDVGSVRLLVIGARRLACLTHTLKSSVPP